MTKIENTVVINSAPAIVWQFLTDPEMMARWMGDKEMKIKVSTDWKIGNPIVVAGFHHVEFKNRGTVLAYKAQELVSYTHLSSLSHLSDVTESYSIITFSLKGANQQTQLSLQLENFPTESIYKHLNFYWQGTLIHFKSFVEDQSICLKANL